MKIYHFYRQKIAFADYKTQEDAVCARDYLQGYVFPNSDKGMCIRISENSKRKIGGFQGQREEKRYNTSKNHENEGLEDHGEYRDTRKEFHGDRHKEGRYYRGQEMHQQHNDPRMKQDAYGYSDRGRNNEYDDSREQRMPRGHSSMQETKVTQQSFLHNPLANSRQPEQMKSMWMGHPQDQQSLDQINNIDYHQNLSHNQEGYLMSEMVPNQSMKYNDSLQKQNYSSSMNEIIIPASSEGGSGMSHLDQYVLPQNTSSVDNSVMGSNPTFMSSGGNIQSMPMSNVAYSSNPNSGARVSVPYSQGPPTSSSMPGRSDMSTGGFGQNPPNYMDALVDICNQFYDILPIPKHATNTVYVEGIPTDARDREVARKSALSHF